MLVGSVQHAFASLVMKRSRVQSPSTAPVKEENALQNRGVFVFHWRAGPLGGQSSFMIDLVSVRRQLDVARRSSRRATRQRSVRGPWGFLSRSLVSARSTQRRRTASSPACVSRGYDRSGARGDRRGSIRKCSPEAFGWCGRLETHTLVETLVERCRRLTAGSSGGYAVLWAFGDFY